MNSEKYSLKIINSIFSKKLERSYAKNILCEKYKLDDSIKKKTLIFLSLFFLQFLLFSQASLVLKDNPYLVLNTTVTTGEVFVVLDNENTSALTTKGTGGNIITKHEKNQIKWNIGTNMGEYTIPFTTATDVANDNANNKASESKIPLIVDITGAGTGNGNVKFSSYTDNNTVDNWKVSDYKPSDVTNVDNVPGVDNSANVVDRFWIIDANGYDVGGKPDVTLSFTYDDQEAASDPTNILSELEIFPQRWNSTISKWSDVTLTGTLDNIGNTFSGVTVTSENLFRSWALVSSSTSLPVNFVSFDSKCVDNQILLKWTTSMEIHNSHFEIEYSTNGKQWNTIGNIKGAGTSSEEINYQYLVDNQNIYQELSYYRLKQVDYDGTDAYSKIENCSCNEGEGIEIISLYPNPSDGEVNIFIYSSEGGKLSLKIYDSIGRLVLDDTINVIQGTNLVSNVIDEISGKYFISASINNGKYYDYSSVVIK